MANIHFKKATLAHKDTIFEWLEEPHMIEFWDNSQEHRQDIEIFMNGRVTPSPYFDGMNSYWVGLIDDEPYSLIMTHEEHEDTDPPDYFKPYLRMPGKTICLDFCIGNKTFLGKGMAAQTLIAFMDYYCKEIQEVARYLIDPFLNNPRAIHVYKKAGFEIVSEFTQEGGNFDQNKGFLMVKIV